MEPHDSRDLDGVIDDVARAMTSTELARDLRPAVASRVSSGPSSTFGWRAGLAAAAIAAVVLVAVVLRPAAVPPPSQVASRLPEAAPPEAVAPVPRAAGAREESPTPPVIRRARAAVRRQVVDEATENQSIVEIEPLADLPLREARATASTQARIDIAPIAVEPVRIRELGEAAE